jgi:hypothetical protein
MEEFISEENLNVLFGDPAVQFILEDMECGGITK